MRSADIIDRIVSGLLFKPEPTRPRLQPLSVLARVSKDQRFDEFRQTDSFKVYEEVMNKFSTPISEYVGR